MYDKPFPLNLKPDSLITKGIRDGWREKLRELFSTVVEQCEEIQSECESALTGMSFYTESTGESEYDDVESAKEISRDESHALSLQGLIESQLSGLDDLFCGSVSGHYSFLADTEGADTLPW